LPLQSLAGPAARASIGPFAVPVARFSRVHGVFGSFRVCTTPGSDVSGSSRRSWPWASQPGLHRIPAESLGRSCERWVLPSWTSTHLQRLGCRPALSIQDDVEGRLLSQGSSLEVLGPCNVSARWRPLRVRSPSPTSRGASASANRSPSRAASFRPRRSIPVGPKANWPASTVSSAVRTSRRSPFRNVLGVPSPFKGLPALWGRWRHRHRLPLLVLTRRIPPSAEIPKVQPSGVCPPCTTANDGAGPQRLGRRRGDC